MSARVYEYCENGGHQPVELAMSQHIDRFGAEALLGRVLTIQEVKQMTIANNIYQAYQSRKDSDDWAKWTSDHPELAEILSTAAHNV